MAQTKPAQISDLFHKKGPPKALFGRTLIAKNLFYGHYQKGEHIVHHRRPYLQVATIKKSSLQDFIGRIGKNLFYGLSAKGSSITNETHRRTQFKLRSSPYPKGQYIGRL